MHRFLMFATLAAVAALAASAPVAAKGPSTASLSGPGLDGALPVKGDGEGGGGTPLGSLVQIGGYFPQVFEETPDPTVRSRPSGDFGPRYRVVYRVPGPSSGVSTIVQDVYPYAKPSPVTYMRPGQRFWAGTRTHGGWFVAGPGLKSALLASGLPESPPTSSASFPLAWTGAGVAAVVVLLVLAWRRRDITRLPELRSTA
jgi:hypothetical protein